ncbi:polysaccharide deacetylase family protein [Tabrizicola sp.]|uniref:polysaccharide deacetylase family protein n=1 Tax=Tabrizicola sp. TaxID=2005166 RepID=UPI00262F029B|nr:polysaccharide deacetylase family protein [Tabrizicola sp.]MDM7930522.1 polysaccharide deacetylase family protein [Tabrizicola sp.]
MRLGLLAGAMAAVAALGSPALAEPQGKGLLSITFDDASRSQRDLGLRAAQDYGLVGTLFVATSFAEEATSEEDGWYMGWSEIRKFRDAGWEIGSHSHTHPHLTQLTDSQVVAEIDTAKAIITARTGTAPVSFAPPFGDFNERTVKRVLERHRFHVLAWGGNHGRNPMQGVDASQIGRLEVSHQVSPAKICGEIAKAARDGVWLVLMFHEFVSQTPGEYQYAIADFRRILACARRMQGQDLIRVVTVADAMKLLGKN